MSIGDAIPWHSWFAWHPVTIHGKSVWLKRVYRRADAVRWPTDSMSSYYSGWIYGDIFDVLSTPVPSEYTRFPRSSVYEEN